MFVILWLCFAFFPGVQVMQLRGEAGKRQVDNAKVALQHNFGIGGAAVVSLYRKPEATSFRLRSKL